MTSNANSKLYESIKSLSSDWGGAFAQAWMEAGNKKDVQTSMACFQVALEGGHLEALSADSRKVVRTGVSALSGVHALPQSYQEMLLGACVRHPLDSHAAKQLIPALTMHVRDKAFWKSMMEAMPSWPATFMNYGVSGLYSLSYRENDAIEGALFHGNDALFEALIDRGHRPKKTGTFLLSGSDFRHIFTSVIPCSLKSYSDTPIYLDALVGAFKPDGDPALFVTDVLRLSISPQLYQEYKQSVDDFVQRHGDKALGRIQGFGRLQNQGDDLKDMLEVALNCVNFDWIDKLQNLRHRMGIHTDLNPMHLYGQDPDVGTFQFENAVKEFVARGYSLNGMHDHRSNQKMAHVIYGDYQKQNLGTTPEVDTVVQQRIVTLINHGLDMDAKDSRGRDAWVYLDSGIKQGIQGMLKAIGAKQALVDITNELRGSFKP